MFISNRPIEGQSIHLILGGALPYLRYNNLDLKRFGVFGKDGSQCLGIGIGKTAASDVFAIVGIPPGVCEPHPGYSKAFKFVVFTDRGEGNAVINLADLVQCTRRVFGHKCDPISVLNDNDTSPSSNALAGVVGLVLDDLFGGNIKRHTHQRSPLAPREPPESPVRLTINSRMIGSSSSSVKRRYPSASTTVTIGKIPRVKSGPPVAESSSAAS